MSEFTISLSWTQLDSMAEWIEGRLTTWGVPTILRLRTQMVLEELFSSLMAEPQEGRGQLCCAFPAPNTLSLQYRPPEGTSPPDLADLQALFRRPCTYGLKLRLNGGSCTILIGQK